MSADARDDRPFDKVEKLELIKRSLGLRHKLKVHESMKAPENHEDLAAMLLSKWELEDELHAIEQMLAEAREENVGRKRRRLSEGHLAVGGTLPDTEPFSSGPEDEAPVSVKLKARRRGKT